MRRIFKSSVLCLAAGAIVACRPDETIITENIPTAGVRFINAVPDTLPLDFRFVDIVESNAHFRIQFRNSPCTSGGVTASCTVQYKNARAGSRRFRVFLNDTIQAVASTQIVPEGTFTFNAGSNYTVLIWGWAAPADAVVPRPGPVAGTPGGSPTMTMDIFEEAVPASAANQVALRMINATRTNLDWLTYCVGAAPCTGTPASATLRGTVNAKTVGPFVNVGIDTLIFSIRPVGGAAGTEIFADSRALIGIPANSSGARNPVTQALLPCIGPAEPQPAPPAAPILKCDIEASPGTTIAGSAITAIVFPGSTACSKAPQVSPFQFTTGSIAGLGASATGYTRTAGSFITDGIAVGQTIGACGFFQSANNGLSTVTGVTATTITVTKTGGTLLEAGTPAGAAGIYSATATGYTRSAGSFVTDGFVTGMTIRVAGFTKPENNGLATVGAVTATTMAVTKTPATSVEAVTTGIVNPLGATATGYTCTGCDFVAQGWVAGHNITAAGFVTPANNGASLILSVTPTAITVNKSGGTVAEAAVAGRSLTSTAVRSFGNAVLRQIAAERPFITFVWDRRPPRPLGM